MHKIPKRTEKLEAKNKRFVDSGLPQPLTQSCELVGMMPHLDKLSLVGNLLRSSRQTNK